MKGAVMQTLFQAMPVILQKAGADDQVREQIAYAVWRKVAGESVARVVALLGLEDQTLRIAVSDRTWKTQLEKLAPEYIARMARLLGVAVVARLEFVVDRKAIDSVTPVETTSIEFHHTEEIMEELRGAAEKIRNDELRQIFLHAAARSLERREERDTRQ